MESASLLQVRTLTYCGERRHGTEALVVTVRIESAEGFLKLEQRAETSVGNGVGGICNFKEWAKKRNERNLEA